MEQMTPGMILQKMLDAAKEYGLGWCEGAPFETAGVESNESNEVYTWAATHCCAIGALALAVDPVAMKAGDDAYNVAERYLFSVGLNSRSMYKGNDNEWHGHDHDPESYAIGAAFRDAMGGVE